eukprot:gene6328-6400_t
MASSPQLDIQDTRTLSDTNDKNDKPVEPGSDIRPISIIDEMKKSYLDYAMSVIVSRALPDVRDGLKPVHRRILFSMYENGYTPDKAYRKSARIVGDVIGKYHPHGDQSIYDALVRMAQTFSMRLPLVDGQGNFGSVDGDPPAAMRYTESRLAKSAVPLLVDIDQNTVDFQANYDGSEREPTVLPARYPNLLVNGAGGIAVGMATNIPPHNLGEVIDGVVALINDPELSIEALMEHIPGPDFPTGGAILGHAGCRAAALTGRGSVIMRAKVDVEELRKDRQALIVSEIPYQVNKSTLIEKIAELVRDKRVEGISDLRDESDRDGMRIVIELKRDSVPDVVLNQLWRFTALQSSFGVNFVALNGGRPEVMNLKDCLEAFVDFREQVVTRRTKFLLGKARDRAHVLVGLAIAVANIDEVIRLIRSSPDANSAREQLMSRVWPAKDMAPLIMLIADPRHTLSEDGSYRLSETQARAILELRLARLTALGRDEIAEELNTLAVEIADYLEILRSRARVMSIITDELLAVKTQFTTPRRTVILDYAADMDDEDLIQKEDMVVTVSHGGYIKRVPLSTYRAQRRGGKGRSGMQTRDEDFVARLFVATTHQPLLFFTSKGTVYKEKVWRLPLAAPQARGKALVNILPLEADERITTIMPLPEDSNLWASSDVMFATTRGTVRRNKLSDFSQVNRAGKIAMKLDDGEAIVDVQMCTERDDVLLTTADGQCIRFEVDDVRVFKGRDSMGVRGINLADGDHVISLAILGHSEATPEERAAYGKMRRAVAGEADTDETNEEADVVAASLSSERYAELSAREETILTLSENGYGKRTSAYEYRVTGRGGKGIVAMAVNTRNGKLVASFPAQHEDEIMLVTDGGQLIRCPVEGIRIAGRSTQGVIVFKTGEAERVVSRKKQARPDMAVKTALYAGSFDPLTKGHMDVIHVATRLCDRLVIAIGIHPGKAPMFKAEERAELIRACWAEIGDGAACALDIITFDTLAVEVARSVGAQIMIRGLRDATDFDYEMQLAGMNGVLSPDIETIFIPAKPDSRHVTATLVRQIASMGGDIGAFVPAPAAEADNTLFLDLKDGRVTIKLRPDLAPKHVAQIKALAAQHFYDGIVFHRVIPGFMAQTGDPTGTGMGGSKLPNIPAEFTQTPFKRGTLGMARSQSPDSANSQFFICFGEASFLNGQYTVFGEVTSGMDLVDKIKKGSEANNGTVTNPDKMLKLRLSSDKT